MFIAYVKKREGDGQSGAQSAQASQSLEEANFSGRIAPGNAPVQLG